MLSSLTSADAPICVSSSPRGKSDNPMSLLSVISSSSLSSCDTSRRDAPRLPITLSTNLTDDS